MRVAICGGGAIGASAAYYLSRRGAEVVVIERTAPACAASGKAGGFLARDWCDGTPLEAMARRSFDLHAELAAEIGADWGYRRLQTYGGRAGARGGGAVAWLAGDVAVRPLGGPETTAQVHPAAFTRGMLRAAEAHGAMLRIGRVEGLAQSGGRVTGVTADGATIPADAVVIAMGPWSILASAWLPLPPVFGLKGHSVVYEAALPAEAVFLECRDADGEVQAPELYPRPDGTAYVCAISSEAPLPLDPAAVAPDPGAIPRLEALCKRLAPALAEARVRVAQACHRPVTQDGLPLIGPIAGLEGAYVATGHSAWGILNAPATGEALAEQILDGAPRALDLAPFDPARLPPLDPARLRVAPSASGA